MIKADGAGIHTGDRPRLQRRGATALLAGWLPEAEDAPCAEALRRDAATTSPSIASAEVSASALRRI